MAVGCPHSLACPLVPQLGLPAIALPLPTGGTTAWGLLAPLLYFVDSFWAPSPGASRPGLWPSSVPSVSSWGGARGWGRLVSEDQQHRVASPHWVTGPSHSAVRAGANALTVRGSHSTHFY